MYMQLVVKGQYISHCMCQILFLNKKKYVYVHFQCRIKQIIHLKNRFSIYFYVALLKA